ncbi:MAG: ABC transporter permease, partial [Clostridiales bacterium]|nr:ABC transporter permease [Clostridiales bacterium]
FRNLLRRRARTLLAITGVTVGTCAIVVMLSIGFGLADSFQKQIESYGNLHMIEVYSSGKSVGMAAPGRDERGVINDKSITAMEKIKGVAAVTPVASEYLTIALGKKIAGTEVMGVKPEVLEKFNFEVQEGRLLQASDKNAILFGNQIPYWFYDPNNYVWSDKPANVLTDKLILTGDWDYGRRPSAGGGSDDQKAVYKEYKVKGVGVLASENDQSAYRAYMKLDELEKIQAQVRKERGERVLPSVTKSYDRALVYVGNINDSSAVSKELRNMEFQTWSPSDWLDAMKQTARMIQGVLGGIGGISLFVAALGITNTMIMSIYERTKEIGVMKVIGANLRDIRKMFLLEAGMIGFIGGALGSMVSCLISLLMNTVLRDVIGMALGFIGGGYGTSISIIPWWVVIAALVFATAIGMAAGFYPARRAMNLSALESLRNE